MDRMTIATGSSPNVTSPPATNPQTSVVTNAEGQVHGPTLNLWFGEWFPISGRELDQNFLGF
jgi:hypothetical protein